MVKKYNIALLPAQKNNELVQFSQKFKFLSEGYQLGENSLPHVTLCQFYADENKIDEIWKNVCDAFDTHSCDLKFEHFSSISFDEKIFWVSLLPDNLSMLHQLHQALLKIVTPASSKAYDPHMTIFNTTNKDYEQVIAQDLKQYSPISDQFILALGECDEFGQFTRLIEQCNW